jgi:pimeloyl-ACP methyl ester carboxylesterase
VIYFVRRPTPGPASGTAGGPASGTAGPDAAAAKRPSAGLFLTEPARGLVDLAALLVAAPWLASAPRGDGHGVLVLPGLLASDTSTLPLRRYLGWLGYHVRGWDLGRNRGPTEEVLAGLPRTLLDQARLTGRPISLVGWSLGGVYARELARREPRHVRQVITLGSPFAPTDPPIAVPSTSVYSRLDGVVSWAACQEPETSRHQNVEVRCSHLGFGVDPATLWLIADRLAAPPGQHRPFRPPPLLRPAYPDRR